MTKKILFTSLILFCFVLFGMAEVCLADVSAELEQAKLNVISLVKEGNYAEAEVQTQKLLTDFSKHKDIAEAVCKIADQYYQLQRHQQADKLYQKIVESWPGGEYAMWSQMHIAMSNTRDGNDAAAEAATNKLIANYSGYKPIARAVCQIADQYYQSQRHQNADKLYQKIVEKWPDTGDAMWAQMHIAMSNIRGGNDAAAQAATDKLIADYSGYEPIARAVCQIADQYYQLQRHQNADKLYQKIVERWPDTGDAMWSQMHIAMSNIRNGNYAAADIEVDKLLAGYPKDEFMAIAVFQIADKYCDTNQYEKANQFYQKVIAGWPDSENPIWRQMAVAILKSQIGDETGANDAIDKLITDFSGHPDLPAAVLRIAEPYWNKALRLEGEGLQGQAKDYFRKALRIAEIAKDKCPNYVESADTLYWTGVCYRALGNYEKTIECFQKVVDNWPDFRHAGEALFLVGVSYENLKEQGLVSTSEADLKLKVTYEHLLKRYPACAGAEHARYWLSRYNSKLEEK